MTATRPCMTVLGTGSPLLPSRAWSSFVLGDSILLDAPPGVVTELHRWGLTPDALQAVFISHLHGDHFAGLPFLLLELEVIRPRSSPLTIIGPPDIGAAVARLYALYYPELTESSPPYNRRIIEATDGGETTVNGIRVVTREVHHTKPPLRSFGAYVEIDGTAVAYSGDTEWCPGLERLVIGAAMVIVDCTGGPGTRYPGHLGVDDVPRMRKLVGPDVPIVLTHRGSKHNVADVPNVLAPQDGDRITIRRTPPHT